jgi:anti-sigma regulatory factor (Ser/Thr protein kinase)
MTKRGYLARKIGQYLDWSKEEIEKLFNLSLSKQSFLKANSENRYEHILYLSDQLLKWNEEQSGITQKIEGLDVRSDLKNALLKAYDIHKKDVFLSSASAEQEQVASIEQKEFSEWEVYRDIIYAATQGKFLLINEKEISKYKTGIVLCEGEIRERSDIPLCRNNAKVSLEEYSFNKTKVMSWILVLSEAITNTIKHAELGKMTLVESVEEEEIRFVIEDNGPGFPLKDLPKNTLLAGYSTKNSMGQGFTLMMKIAKQVILYTSPRGSTIILTFDSTKEVGGSLNATG